MFDPASGRPIEEWFRSEMVLETELHLFTQSIEWPTLREARKLADRVASLSDRVHVHLHNFQEEHAEVRRGEIARIPTLTIGRSGQSRVRYVGVPSGRLYPNLLRDLMDASRGDTLLRPESLEALRRTAPRVSLRVYSDTRASAGAFMARQAHQLALAAPSVQAETISVDDFPELADAAGVWSIPTVEINGGQARIEGVLPEASFLAQLIRVADEAPATGRREARPVAPLRGRRTRWSSTPAAV